MKSIQLFTAIRDEQGDMLIVTDALDEENELAFEMSNEFWNEAVKTLKKFPEAEDLIKTIKKGLIDMAENIEMNKEVAKDLRKEEEK